MGFYESKRECQKSIRGINIGSWSTKEELPQAIIEYNDSFLMFEIESNNSWFYELSDISKQLYLYFSGANFPYGDFYKKLSNGETFTTPTVCFALSSSLNNVLGDMTVYRRKIKGRCLSDENLPVIFNEFMHLSWDQPNENTVYKMAKTVKELGADYYVIDCGWHDECAVDEIYKEFVENKKEALRSLFRKEEQKKTPLLPDPIMSLNYIIGYSAKTCTNVIYNSHGDYGTNPSLYKDNEVNPSKKHIYFCSGPNLIKFDPINIKQKFFFKFCNFKLYLIS